MRLIGTFERRMIFGGFFSQFYVDDCFWTTPTYMNRIIQALYQLNDLKFDLLSTQQYQLDVSWPTIEFVLFYESEIVMCFLGQLNHV